MSATLATASAKLIDPVIQVARHSQQDPGALLASVGIEPEHIAHSGARIPAALFSRLLLELAQRTGNPHLALRIGEATQPRMLGSVGFLMSTAANLRQAYQLLNDYLPLLIEGLHLSLEQEAEQVTLVLDLADDNDRSLVEWLLAGLHNWTRWLTGKQVPLVSVDFAFPEPASAQIYEQFFAAEVRFNADRNRLRFSACHLELRCLDANEEMQRLHQSFADQLLSSAGRDGTLVAQIKSLIRNQLSSHQAISRQQVAAHLNLSLRTMQRKLDQQGTPFQTLFDQTRKDLALQLIQRGDRSFGEIAFQLGFSGLSAFQKAFKRWTGVAPGAYRSAQRPVTILPGRSQPRALSDLIGTSGVVEEQFYPLALQLLTQISEWQQRNLKRPLLSPARIGISSDDQQDYRLTLVDPDPLNRAELLEQLSYEAPETSLALPYAVDQRSELYQLGCLFYCLLHGQPPYQETDPGELLQAHLQQTPVLDPSLSSALTRILTKLLALPAEERYQSLTGLQSDLKQSLLACQQQQPLSAFEPGGSDAPAQIIELEHQAGREQVQQTLLQLLQNVHSEGRLVLIEGASGSGKSSLAECLRGPLFRAQGALLSVQFDPSLGDDMESIVELARQRLRHKLALPQARRDIWAQRLQRQLGPHAALLQPLLPELTALLPASLTTQVLSHSERRPLQLEALAKLFRANRDPLVLLLDDLHHAGSDALALIQLLLEPLGQQPLLLLISYDPAQIKPDSPLALALPSYRYHRFCTQLPLSALPRSAIQQLLQNLFQCITPELTALADWLYQRSAGHPATLARELEQLHQRRWICYQPQPQHWSWQPQQLPQALDQELQQLLSIALTELPAATRELLQWAAIVGDPFELELLAQIRSDPLARVTIHLWPAQQAGLLQPADDTRQAFSHPTLRSQLLSSLNNNDRARIHWLLGNSLYSLGQAQSAPISLQRCVEQFNQGYQRAPQPLRRKQLLQLNLDAARQALRQGNLGLARSGYQQARQLLQPGELKTAIAATIFLEGAELARRCGDLDCAEQWLAELQPQTDPAATLSPPLAMALSRLQLQRGHPRAAAQMLLGALAALEIKIPRTGAALSDRLQQLLTGAGAAPSTEQDADALLQQLLRVAEAQLDPLLYLGALASLAQHCHDDDPSHAPDQPLRPVLLAVLQLELLAQPERAQALPPWALNANRNSDLGPDLGTDLGTDSNAAIHTASGSIRPLSDRFESQLIRATRITPWIEPLAQSITQLEELVVQARQAGQQEIAERCALPLFNSRWLSAEPLAQLHTAVDAEQAFLQQALSPECLPLADSAIFLVRQLTLAQPAALEPLALAHASPWSLCAQCAVHYLLDQRSYWPGLLLQVEACRARLSGLYAHTQLLLFSSLMAAELGAQSGTAKPLLLQRLHNNLALLQHWATLNPQGFDAQAALLAAELEQLSGQPCEAAFEYALRAAEQAASTPLTALTLERFSVYCQRRGQLTQARLLLAEARGHYRAWGAHAKLAQLNRQHPDPH